jgi:hypothetical protein
LGRLFATLQRTAHRKHIDFAVADDVFGLDVTSIHFGERAPS